MVALIIGLCFPLFDKVALTIIPCYDLLYSRARTKVKL
jgi:hypothetical protein